MLTVIASVSIETVVFGIYDPVAFARGLAKTFKIDDLDLAAAVPYKAFDLHCVCDHTDAGTLHAEHVRKKFLG